MPHVEEEQKQDDMFRNIGEAVETVEAEAGEDDGPQVMDNIGTAIPALQDSARL